MPASFAGFDTSAYPGDTAMQKWKTSSPYGFAGYYLASPCHRVSGWMGKRATLASMGWKFLPVYVGQQAVGASGCGHNVLSEAQARLDAADASAKMTGEGFAGQSFVYLDIERCEVFPPGMTDYIATWVSEVASAGFGPAVYCHRHNATDVRTAVGGAVVRYWIVGGVTAHFNLATSKPADSGVAFADLWQRPEPVTRKFAGVQILIDEDISAFADPSAPIPT